jgi:hypothetical protein
VRTTLWRYHLSAGCVLALAYVYLPHPAPRAGSLGSSAAVTRAGGSAAAAILTMVAYLIGILGYAMLIRARSPGRTGPA